jgi:plasmid replication initiation protein
MTYSASDYPLSEMQVNMSNALTRSAHSLNLSEKRIIAACIAKTDQMPGLEEVKRRKAWLVRLTAKDYAATFGVDLNTAYEQLKDGAKNLFQRHIRTTRMTRKGPKIRECRWVGAVEYYEGEGTVELDWWHEVVPHLMGLETHFTQYKLWQTSALRSIYSWRLFELLQSWRSEGRYDVSIEDFCTVMDVPDCYRTNFKHIRVRVIEPAIRELTEKNNMTITWQPQNAGRKVVGIVFKFECEPQVTEHLLAME